MENNKTIIVVDDEAEFQTLFTIILSKEGYTIHAASNGMECLALVETVDPDLIILDVHMPVMDGYETISHLRKIKKLKYTPIVFLTGVGTAPPNIDTGYTLGGTEYWTKPISIEELTVRVRSVIRISEAEKQLRKLQQSFYSMVVHDLRNPIGAILGFSELLMEDKEAITAEQREMISEMNAASVDLLHIVKDLLELSKFESGDYVLHREPVQLHRMIESVFDSLKVMRIQKNISLKIDTGAVDTIAVDAEWFNEVFENLFDNALRFTPPKGVISVTASLLPSSAPSDTTTAQITIADTGRGIAPDEIPMLFDKNRIMDPKFRKGETRTGLGLVVCREIIEAHGGTIHVDSTVGKGSTFIITLPQ